MTGLMEQNAEYQRRLAEHLFDSEGFEEAMIFAREREWDGVLDCLLEIEKERRLKS